MKGQLLYYTLTKFEFSRHAPTRLFTNTKCKHCYNSQQRIREIKKLERSEFILFSRFNLKKKHQKQSP